MEILCSGLVSLAPDWLLSIVLRGVEIRFRRSCARVKGTNSIAEITSRQGEALRPRPLRLVIGRGRTRTPSSDFG